MSCPTWCIDKHDDGDPVHRSDPRSVALALEGAGLSWTPTLQLHLEQEPGEAGPVIRMRMDGKHLARMMPGEATSAALRLIGLVEAVITG